MSTRRVLLVAVALGLLLVIPVQALAALCITPSVGATFVLTGAAGPEGFFFILGELVQPCTGLSTQSAPVTGTGHLRPDGRIHLGLAVSPTANCTASFYEAFLDPPAFNSGTGTVNNPGVTFFMPRTYSPASCPALPQ